MSNKPQSYPSHAKIDPAFHLFVLPVLLINIFVVAYLLIRHPGIGGAWLLLVSIAFLVLAARLRSWATLDKSEGLVKQKLSLAMRKHRCVGQRVLTTEDTGKHP